MNYAVYGLDTVKKEKDEDYVSGSWLCIWCNRHQSDRGFNLCFSNWIICPGCVTAAFHYQDAQHRWKEDVDCFKCRQRHIRGFQTHPDLACDLYLCESCMKWAREALDSYDKNKRQQQLQKAVMDQNNNQRYSNEELRDFKVIVTNKLEEADKELKRLKVVLTDCRRGIKIAGYEEATPHQVENEIKWQQELISELHNAVERIKKKTFGIDNVTGKLIPKEELLKSPAILRFDEIIIEKKADTALAAEVRKCRVCGCTEEDCSQCIAATGEACHWVEADLCSRCEKEMLKADEQSQPIPPAVYDEQPFSDIPLVGHDPAIEQKLSEKPAENANEDLAEEPSPITTNFFSELRQSVNSSINDITLRIRLKADKLEVLVIPNAGKDSLFAPIVITGSDDEMNTEFFGFIASSVMRASKDVTDMAAYHKKIEEAREAVKREAAAQTVQPQTTPAPATVKPEVKKAKPVVKPKVAEPSLFGDQ